MTSHVKTVAFDGVEAIEITVQVQIASGLPKFTIVGLADKAVSEAKERIQSAFASIGLSLPPKRITVNLAPADREKTGTHYDVAIAAGILAEIKQFRADRLNHYYLMGELGLDGMLAPVSGVLSAAFGAKEKSLGIICPQNQGGEAAFSGNADVVALHSLYDMIEFFSGRMEPTKPEPAAKVNTEHMLDLVDIKGQDAAKRALIIAAAGGHHMLLIGEPGAGKSMLAKRLPTILPPMHGREMLDTSMIYSVAGKLENDHLIKDRPFRAVHHTASEISIIGGGTKAMPGEISLAHNGVLFLDELPEFRRTSLEALRQPLESGKVLISRAARHIAYPARFQMIAAMNPCPCGHFGNIKKECATAPNCALKYQNRISGPLMDRIDIFFEVKPVAPWELADAKSGLSSADARKIVMQTREFTCVRLRNILGPNAPLCNADLDGERLEAAVNITDDAKAILIESAKKFELSARAYHRIMKVARTIADMEQSETLEKSHVAEALSYRRKLPGQNVR